MSVALWQVGGRALALAAVAAMVACSKPASGNAEGARELEVNARSVEVVEIRRAVEAVGTLAARDEAVVSAEVEARVARLGADMGDRVAAGTPLVFLDAEKLEGRADEQRAALEQTRARYGARGGELPPVDQTPDVLSAAAKLAEAEQQLARAVQLASRSLVSQQELEQAETGLQTARAALYAAQAAARQLRAEVTAREAAVRVADRELQDTVIRAPFAGVIAERLVSVGQFVSVETPVMRIVRLEPLRVLADIPERFAPALRVGHDLTVLVDAFPDRPVKGRITRISPSVDLKTRAFAIEGEVPNEDGSLKPGTFARVRIVTDRIDKTLAVPVTAVQTLYGTSRAFVIRDGQLAGVELKLGDRLGPRVEVLEGLEAGITIVADNVEGLNDGVRVKVRGTTP